MNYTTSIFEMWVLKSNEVKKSVFAWTTLVITPGVHLTLTPSTVIRKLFKVDSPTWIAWYYGPFIVQYQIDILYYTVLPILYWWYLYCKNVFPILNRIYMNATWNEMGLRETGNLLNLTGDNLKPIWTR